MLGSHSFVRSFALYVQDMLKHMTIFVDLASGRIIHAIEGTAKDRIMPFLRKLQKRAKSLKAVAIDMSRSFFWAVCEALAKVTVVFDRPTSWP